MTSETAAQALLRVGDVRASHFSGKTCAALNAFLPHVDKQWRNGATALMSALETTPREAGALPEFMREHLQLLLAPKLGDKYEHHLNQLINLQRPLLPDPGWPDRSYRHMADFLLDLAVQTCRWRRQRLRLLVPAINERIYGELALLRTVNDAEASLRDSAPAPGDTSEDDGELAAVAGLVKTTGQLLEAARRLGEKGTQLAKQARAEPQVKVAGNVTRLAARLQELARTSERLMLLRLTESAQPGAPLKREAADARFDPSVGLGHALERTNALLQELRPILANYDAVPYGDGGPKPRLPSLLNLCRSLQQQLDALRQGDSLAPEEQRRAS